MTQHQTPQTAQYYFSEMGRWLDDLNTRQHNADVRATGELERLARQVSDLSGQVAQLERRFTELLAAEHERRRPQTPRAEDLGWYEVADELSELCRHLTNLAREVLSPSAQSIERARLVQVLMVHLINGDQQELHELLAPRRFRGNTKSIVKDLQGRYAAIIDKATGIGRDFGWGEWGEPGQDVFDRSRQLPWPGCSAEDPVDFVVTPPFLVENAVRVKALVYTNPDLAPDPQ